MFVRCVFFIFCMLPLTFIFSEPDMGLTNRSLPAPADVEFVLESGYDRDAQLINSLAAADDMFVDDFSGFQKTLSRYALPLVIINLKANKPFRGLSVYYENGEKERFAVSDKFSKTLWRKEEVLAHIPPEILLKLMSYIYSQDDRLPRAGINSLLDTYKNIRREIQSFGPGIPKETKIVMVNMLTTSIDLLTSILNNGKVTEEELKQYFNKVRPYIFYFLEYCNKIVTQKFTKYADIIASKVNPASTVFVVYQGDIAAPIVPVYTQSLINALKKHNIHTQLIVTTNNVESVETIRNTVVGNYIGVQVLESPVLNKNIEALWKKKGAKGVYESTLKEVKKVKEFMSKQHP